MNYAEKQGKKDINNRDENIYYFSSDDKKLNSKKIIIKIDLPFVNFF